MKQCTACHRHVRPLDPACPFCGELLRTGGAGRLGAVILLGALEAACGDKPGGEGTGSGSESTGTSGGGGVSTTSATGSSTDGGTSVAPTTTTTTATTNTPSGVTSTSDPSEGDGGSTFYGGGPISDFTNFECDIFQPDCPPGEKCALFDPFGGVDLTSSKCVPIAADPQPPGAACTIEGDDFSGVDDCEAGAWCDPLTDTCRALCIGPPEAQTCPEGFTCSQSFGFLQECLADCHPLTATCPMGEVCVALLSSDQFVCTGDASGDAGQALDPCMFVNVCDPGLACASETVSGECVMDGSGGCCTPFCDTMQPPDCPDPEQVCVPWFMADPPAGFETLGVCALPPP
jgi:hypothetical protein